MIIIDSGADATAVAADPGFPRSAPDSRYPVRHNFPPGGSGERAASSLSRVTGYRRSHRRGETMPNYLLNHARSGSDTRTASTSPLSRRFLLLL